MNKLILNISKFFRNNEQADDKYQYVLRNVASLPLYNWLLIII